MIVLGHDFETHPLGNHSILPTPVCWSVAVREHVDALEQEQGRHVFKRVRAGVREYLFTDYDPECFSRVLRKLLVDDQIHLVGANHGFDLGVPVYNDPSILPLVFEAGHALRLHDIQIREKLLKLSTTGNLEYMTLPDGTEVRLRYDVGTLAKRYLGMGDGAKATLKPGEKSDAWRVNYHALSGRAAADYPEEARDYSLDDAFIALRVFEKQERERRTDGHSSCNTGEIQTLTDFCFKLVTAHGLRVDRDQVERLELAVLDVLSADKHQPLYDAGLLDPAIAERVRRTKAGKLMRHGKGERKGEPIIVAAKEEKVNKKAVQQHVLDLCRTLEKEPVLTDKGVELGVAPGDDTYVKYISTSKKVLVDIAALDPSGLLQIYAERQKWIKVKTTYLPVLRSAECVWAGYNVLVSTGRTSSMGGGKDALYWSCNIQQMPRLSDGHLNVRACFVPDEGNVFCAIDFSALELYSFAQTCYKLFGYSVLRDALNAGSDPHAFLGAQLCVALDPEFKEYCADRNIVDKFDRYHAFAALAETDRKKYKHWRTFAKPVGLGFPGGLGIRTFRELAYTAYGVFIESDELAKTLKDLWLDTFPEAKQYLQEWVPAQEDKQNASDEFGGLCYESPLGMFRANANYCATANGNALQTPSAEGAKLGIIDCVERCVNERLGDKLYGQAMLLAFVHDEMIFEFPRERAREFGEHCAKIMIDNMRLIMPDMDIKAEPAYMTRWLKGAEGADLLWSMDENGELYHESLDTATA